jgi:hypothetical protein
MKTSIRLISFDKSLAVIVVALDSLICSSAFSEPEKKSNVRGAEHKPVKNAKIYVISSASFIPEPIDGFGGPIPTTAIPLLVIRHR